MAIYHDRQNLKLLGINRNTLTAGPGMRLELFLKGCIRGIKNPCSGCFNESSWSFDGPVREMDVHQVADFLIKDAWNKQVTICGGEPLLQTRNLIEVFELVRAKVPDMHIIVYTAYPMENLLQHGVRYFIQANDPEDMINTLISYARSYRPEKKMITLATPNDIRKLMGLIDWLVDGDFQIDQRIPVEPNMPNGQFIGSKNQRVFNTKATLQAEPNLVYETALDFNTKQKQYKGCKTCGHAMTNKRLTYCTDDCKKRYHQYKKSDYFHFLKT